MVSLQAMVPCMAYTLLSDISTNIRVVSDQSAAQAASNRRFRYLYRQGRATVIHRTPNAHRRIAQLSIPTVLVCCLLLVICEPWSTVRATPTEVAAATTVYLPLVTTSIGACNDIENNDIPAQAQPLTTVGQACFGAFDDDPVGEDDYYTITLNPGQSITIDLTEMPTGADYDLLLYRGLELVASSNEQGTTSEHISYTNTSSQTTTYLIRINIYAKSTTSPNIYVLTSSEA